MLGTILGILWFILKIILWILLAILGLVLLLILMVLLVPIRYKVVGSKYEDINADVRVTYLLRLFRVYFHYSPAGYWYKVKVLFFTVLSDSTVEDSSEAVPEPEKDMGSPEQLMPPVPKPEEEKPKPKPVQQKQEAKTVEKPKPQKPKTEALSKPKEEVSTSIPAEEAEGPPDHPTAQPPESPPSKEATAPRTTQTGKPKEEEPKPKKEKPKKTPDPEEEGPSILDQIREFWDFLREERNVGVLRFILGKLFKAIGSILPKKFYAKLHLGLEDPATTAYIVGGASILYPKVKDSLQITGDFDNQVLEGEVDIKGRIIPGIFVWTAIRIYLDGRIRRLIKEVMKMTK